MTFILIFAVLALMPGFLLRYALTRRTRHWLAEQSFQHVLRETGWAVVAAIMIHSAFFWALIQFTPVQPELLLSLLSGARLTPQDLQVYMPGLWPYPLYLVLSCGLSYGAGVFVGWVLERTGTLDYIVSNPDFRKFYAPAHAKILGSHKHHPLLKERKLLGRAWLLLTSRGTEDLSTYASVPTIEVMVLVESDDQPTLIVGNLDTVILHPDKGIHELQLRTAYRRLLSADREQGVAHTDDKGNDERYYHIISNVFCIPGERIQNYGLRYLFTLAPDQLDPALQHLNFQGLQEVLEQRALAGEAEPEAASELAASPMPAVPLPHPEEQPAVPLPPEAKD